MSSADAVDRAWIAVTWGATCSLESVERGAVGAVPAASDVGGTP